MTFTKRITIIIAASMIACASACLADSIQLRRRAVVDSDTVRLSQVAALEGEAAEQLADTIIVRDPKQTSLTQDQLRQALAKTGANLAKISLKGFETCEIVREASKAVVAPAEARAIEAPAAPVLANPTEPVASESSLTVGQRLTDWLRQTYGGQPDDLRVTVADRDRKELDQLVGSDQLVFTGGTSLGRRTVTMQRMRGEKLVGTQRFTVDLAVRQLALVVVKPLNKGATIAATDVEVREVFVDRDPQKSLTRVEDVVGRVVATALREGAVLTSDTVRAALLVHRNELIRVQAIAGGLLIQTTARALEDGEDGQTIQARNERSREVFTVRVTGSRQAMLVSEPVNEAKSAAKPGKSEARGAD